MADPPPESTLVPAPVPARGPVRDAYWRVLSPSDIRTLPGTSTRKANSNAFVPSTNPAGGRGLLSVTKAVVSAPIAELMQLEHHPGRQPCGCCRMDVPPEGLILNLTVDGQQFDVRLRVDHTPTPANFERGHSANHWHHNVVLEPAYDELSRSRRTILREELARRFGTIY